MYAITGAFGQTGAALCERLFSAGHKLRLIVRRDDALAADWRSRGAEVCVMDLSSTARLADAFRGVSGAYLMNPPAYLENDLFTRAQEIHQSLIDASNDAAVPHVVALSSVGAHQASGTGNILTTHDFEHRLKGYKGTLDIVRAANFIENWAWSLQPVIEHGVLPSMFLPLDRALPMVSAHDIGLTVASLLTDPSANDRIVELHGPEEISPLDAGLALSRLLKRAIEVVPVVEDDWRAVFLAKGFPETTVRAFCEMFHGFNDGTVAFQGGHETRYGTTTLSQALAKVLEAHV